MAILQSDGVNNATDLILRRNGTEGLRLTSSTVQVSSINNGPLAGFRNAIINGNFDIWQRGTSFTGPEYGADRWITERIGSTCTTSRQSFTLGQTDVPGEPTYFCRFVVGSVSGAGNSVVLNQRIEGVRTFAGQTVTLSFWAKANATKFMSVEFSQNFGTGGTPSTRIIEIDVQKFTLTTSWQKFTKTITLPSIAGKTLGTNNNDVLQIYFWLDAGSDSNSRTDSLGHQSGTFDIAQVQVEAGPVATPFERRPIGTELALCQRYYEILPGWSDTRNTTNTGNSFPFNTQLNFKVTKRSTPTMTALSLFTSFSSIGFFNITQQGCIYGVQQSASGAGASSFVYSSEGFIANAEL